MKINRLLYVLLGNLFLLLALAGSTSADTPVSGAIASDTTWALSESPYIVTNGVLVNSAVTLTIEPGVVIKFNGEKALQIDGELIARGTENNMITFTSVQKYPAPGDWGYILFSDSSVDAVYDAEENYTGGSVVEHCLIEYAGGSDLANNGSLIINASSPFIHRSRISNNKSRGIEVYNDGNPVITGNTIGRNVSTGGGGGIRVESENAVIIKNNVIHDNATDYIVGTTSYGSGGGILAIGSSSNHIIIDNNLLSGNSAKGGGGIYADNAEVTHNFVSHNKSIEHYGGGGIASGGNSRSTGINVLHNVIINNIADQKGGGVYINKGSLNENIIAFNSVRNEWNSGGKGGGVYTIGDIEVRSNAILGNEIKSGTMNGDSEYGSGLYLYYPQNITVSYNTISGNLHGGSNGVGGIYVDYLGRDSSYSSLINNNNIYSNTGYEMFYYTALGSVELGAENNYWGTEVETEIQAEIFDWFDNAELEIISYSPYETAIRTDAPLSPPQGFTVSKGNDPYSITLTWTANAEGDLAGYKVYWDNDSGLPYTNMSDVGNVTSHTISGINGKFRFAVTAYDSEYSESGDNPNTIVNESQTNGNESWYSSENVMKVGPSIEASAASHDFGNVTIAVSSDPEEFVIANAGTEDLIIGTITITGTDASSYTIQTDNASDKTIQPSESRTIEVAFTPGSEGLKNAYLSIPSNDGDIPEFTIPLTGVGDPPGTFGTVKWQYDGHGFGTPAIGSNGTIYAGSSERPPGTITRQLYAFNPDGTVKWTFPIEGDAYNSTPAIGKDGTIYMGSVYGYKFYAINPDGTEKWVFEAKDWKNDEGWTWSSPSIGEDGIIYFGSRDNGAGGKVYALNPDGTLKWATNVGTGSTRPAIAADGTIYTGTGMGELYALDPDGEVKWVYAPPYPNWVSSAPSIGPDGTVYIGKLNYGGKRLHAINPDGTLMWQFEAGGTVNGSPVIGADGTIYAGADDNKMYAINPDGTLKWSYETGAAINTAPLIGEYGTVYFGSADNYFYALNPHGTLKWSFDTGSAVESSPTLGTDGTIYFGSHAAIYAISCSAKKPADSSWPMYGHDSRHTGNIMQDIQPIYPVANADTDQTVNETDLVTLNAGASFHPGGGNITGYEWSQLSGPQVSLLNDESISPEFTAPNVGIDGEILTFQVKITDDKGLQSTDIVAIEVSDVTISTSSHDFGSTETAGTVELTISNVTDQDLAIYQFNLSDTRNFALDLSSGDNPIGGVPQSIAPGSSVTFSVIFNPLSPGMFEEQLIISSNDPDTPVMEISLYGWGKNDPAQEDFTVTLGEDRVFTAFNVDRTDGTAVSDAQNAYSIIESGPYEDGTSAAWAGVKFLVEDAHNGETMSDALISITLSYKLESDFDVLPPSEKGGGSANTRIYTWIANFKRELDQIVFNHNSGYDEKSGTVTFTQPWIHLNSGSSYEVTAELNSQAHVYEGYDALSLAKVTVQEVKIDFSPYARAIGTRALPSHAAINSDIDVNIEINVNDSNPPDELTVNEYIPSWWTLNSAIPEYDNYDASTGKIRWILTGSNEVSDQSISYNVHVPGTETFGLVRSFDGELEYTDSGSTVTKETLGDKETAISGLIQSHDTSYYDTDHNWVIGDFELLDAIDAWAAGTLGDFGLLDLIDCWAAGCYHWDAGSGKHIAGC